MKKLILHCGSTKTGTSAIQYGLGLNHKFLLDKSINYPLTNRLRKKLNKENCVVGNAKFISNFGNSITNKNVKKEKSEGARERLIRFLEECQSTKSDLTILSSESIPGKFDKNSILVLRDLLHKYFDKIIVFYYVRDILDHSVSQYNEYVKRRKQTTTFSEYSLTYKCRFKNHIEVLLTGFGENNLEVKNYDDEKDNLWLNFIKNLQFQDLDPKNLESPKKINRSLCKEEIEFYRIINKKSKNGLTKHLKDFWEKNNALTNKSIIPSLEVLNRFEKENIKKLDYVNNFLKGSKSPLKIVSNNLRDKINNYSAYEEEDYAGNKGYKYLYFINLCNYLLKKIDNL